MDRRLLVAAGLLALVALAGCTTLFGDDVEDPEALSQDAEYDFDTDGAAYVEINRENYTAVYDVSERVNEEPVIRLYRTDRLAVERPLPVYGLQFRHPNGTVDRYVDGNATRVYGDGSTERTDALAVRSTRDRTVVELPAEEGHLAFTTPKTGKRVAIHTPVHGSYEVALPPNTDASLPLLSQVRPANDDREERGDRVHLQWEEVETSVVIVRWYLDRDLWLFGGLTAVAALAGAVGAGYYYLQIQRAKARRQEEGLDVDDDDDRRRPPPGMQ